MKNNTAGWMEFGKICLKWGGGGEMVGAGARETI